MRTIAKKLGLNQALAGDASVTIFFLCDLNHILNKLGNRGYRVAQLDASIIAGKFYIAAYAQNLGATGLTFRDDDVVDFLTPELDRIVTFMISIGHKKKKKTQ